MLEATGVDATAEARTAFSETCVLDDEAARGRFSFSDKAGFETERAKEVRRWKADFPMADEPNRFVEGVIVVSAGMDGFSAKTDRRRDENTRGGDVWSWDVGAVDTVESAGGREAEIVGSGSKDKRRRGGEGEGEGDGRDIRDGDCWTPGDSFSC
jgi:hypothetical protein